MFFFSNHTSPLFPPYQAHSPSCTSLGTQPRTCLVIFFFFYAIFTFPLCPVYSWDHFPPCVLQFAQYWTLAFSLSLFFFKQLYLQHVEVHWLAARIRAAAEAYTTATATLDLRSHICDLCHSLWQRQVINPLSESRAQTHILPGRTLGIQPTEPQQERSMLSIL